MDYKNITKLIYNTNTHVNNYHYMKFINNYYHKTQTQKNYSSMFTDSSQIKSSIFPLGCAKKSATYKCVMST